MCTINQLAAYKFLVYKHVYRKNHCEINCPHIHDSPTSPLSTGIIGMYYAYAALEECPFSRVHYQMPANTGLRQWRQKNLEVEDKLSNI